MKEGRIGGYLTTTKHWTVALRALERGNLKWRKNKCVMSGKGHLIKKRYRGKKKKGTVQEL